MKILSTPRSHCESSVAPAELSSDWCSTATIRTRSQSQTSHNIWALNCRTCPASSRLSPTHPASMEDVFEVLHRHKWITVRLQQVLSARYFLRAVGGH